MESGNLLAVAPLVCRRRDQERREFMPIILWLLGVPLSLIIVLWLVGVF
ncbi:hypothetical protein ACM64Y_06885 [Novispirillum sp. DQ9]